LSDQAEDIVQVTLVRLLAVVEKSGGETVLAPSYIKKAAYNATVDEMRRRFRRKEVPEGDGLESHQVSARPPEQEDHAVALDVHDAIRDCLGRLIRPRRVAVSCHLQGYSVPEAARFLGWTPKKTEHLIRRGLADLRSCLTGKGVTP
jgi:RNA polymerase sigma factor (sigma-70 family)